MQGFGVGLDHVAGDQVGEGTPNGLTMHAKGSRDRRDRDRDEPIDDDLATGITSRIAALARVDLFASPGKSVLPNKDVT